MLSCSSAYTSGSSSKLNTMLFFGSKFRFSWVLKALANFSVRKLFPDPKSPSVITLMSRSSMSRRYMYFFSISVMKLLPLGFLFVSGVFFVLVIIRSFIFFYYQCCGGSI